MMTASTLKALGRLLLANFAGGILICGLFDADAIDVVVLQFLFLPWIVGPAIVFVLLMRGEESTSVLWAWLVGELTVIGSTIWLWVELYRNPDAQNGIAMFLFPLPQAVAAILYIAVVLGLRSAVKRRQPLN